MALSRARAKDVSRAALVEVAHLTGKDAEKVVALRRDGDEWVLDVEVVDLRRVPDTTDFMATYRVHLDDAATSCACTASAATSVRGSATRTEHGSGVTPGWRRGRARSPSG